MPNVKQQIQEADRIVPRISPGEVRNLRKEGVDFVLIDVRDGLEVAANGKVRGSINVSRGVIEFRADPDSPTFDPKVFGPGKKVILYCASGARSALAGKALKDLGYTDVHNMGAFRDWLEAEGEIDPPDKKDRRKPPC